MNEVTNKPTQCRWPLFGAPFPFLFNVESGDGLLFREKSHFSFGVNMTTQSVQPHLPVPSQH